MSFLVSTKFLNPPFVLLLLSSSFYIVFSTYERTVNKIWEFHSEIVGDKQDLFCSKIFMFHFLRNLSSCISSINCTFDALKLLNFQISLLIMDHSVTCFSENCCHAGWVPRIKSTCAYIVHSMVAWVVEFPRRDTKLDRFLVKNQYRESPLSTVSRSTIHGIVRFQIDLNSIKSLI